MVYDEATGTWVPKWGYKGANKAEENQWLVEVDDKKTSKAGKDVEELDPRKLSRQERLDRIKKNERQMKKNVAGKGSAVGSGSFKPRGGGVKKGKARK